MRYDSNKTYVSMWSSLHDLHVINNLQHKNARKTKEKLSKLEWVIPTSSRKTIKFENNIRKQNIIWVESNFGIYYKTELKKINLWKTI